MTASMLAELSKIPAALLGDLFSTKAEGLTNVGLFEVFKNQFKDLTASAFSSIEDATPDQLMTISPEGIMDILTAFMETTLWVTTISDREIAGELFGEMVQEGVSNAIQTSLGGALQTLYNVKRGGFPAMQDYNIDLGKNVTQHDENYLGFVSASVGCNLLTTAYDLVRGANDEIEQRYNSLLRVVENISAQITTHSIGIVGTIHVAMQTIITRLILMPLEVAMVYHEVIRRISEEHMARLNELEDSLEAIKMYYDEGIIDNEILATEEALKVKAEIMASQTVFNQFINSVQNEYSNAITEIQNNVSNIINAVDPVIGKIFDELCTILNSINVASDSEVKDEFLAKIDDIIKRVAAYRDLSTIDINIS